MDIVAVLCRKKKNGLLLTEMMKMNENASPTRVTTLISASSVPPVSRAKPHRMAFFPQQKQLNGDGGDESFSIKLVCIHLFNTGVSTLLHFSAVMWCRGKVLAHNPEVSGSKLSAALSPPRKAKCNISPCYFSNLARTYENECPQHPFITFTFKCSAKSCSVI